MAAISQVRELARKDLRERVERLATAVDEDGADFAQVAGLADAVGELADAIAGIYGDLEDWLTRAPEKGASAAESQPSAPASEDATKEELLEEARELNVEGRSSMSKDELAQAIEAEESVTKEELLERARDADIEGRSSMTKEELRKALHDAA